MPLTKTSVSWSFTKRPTLNTTYPFSGATYGNVMPVMATPVSGGPHCEKFPPAVPAPPPSPGAQFRKNLWPLHNYRPELDFWRCQQSFRNWAQQGDAEAGAWEQDAIRNITGTAGSFKAVPGPNRFSGAFTNLASTGSSADSDGTGPAALSFDASLVVHTGPQNVPQHVWQPLVIYLGRSAQV